MSDVVIHLRNINFEVKGVVDEVETVCDVLDKKRNFIYFNDENRTVIIPREKIEFVEIINDKQD